MKVLKIITLTLCLITFNSTLAYVKSQAIDNPLAAIPSFMSLIQAKYALSQEDYQIAVEHYLEVAKLESSPYFYHQAAITAIHFQDLDYAYLSTEKWLSEFPNDLSANYFMTILAIRQNKAEKALDSLKKLLVHSVELEKFNSILNTINNSDEDFIQKFLHGLQKIKPNLNSSKYILALIVVSEFTMNKIPQATAAAKKLTVLSPEWPISTSLYIEILISTNQLKIAENYLAKKVSNSQNDSQLKLKYAKVLLLSNKKAQAKNILQEISGNSSDEANLVLAELAFADNDTALAEYYLEKIDNNSQFYDYASYKLAQSKERSNKLRESISYYEKINHGDYYFQSKIQQSILLIKLGESKKATDVLHNIQFKSINEIKRAIFLELGILEEAHSYHNALKLLNQAVQSIPEDIELLYARSIIAGKLGKTDLKQNDLRAVLTIDPENLNALIHLGALLANSPNTRAEALIVISKALDIEPNNAQALNHMGWLQYKSGDNLSALQYLNKSYAIDPSSSTAINLITVLINNGQKSTAKNILKTALQISPNDQQLKELSKNFRE